MLLLLVNRVKLHDLNWLRLVFFWVSGRRLVILVVLDHDAAIVLFVGGLLSNCVHVIFYFGFAIQFRRKVLHCIFRVSCGKVFLPIDLDAVEVVSFVAFLEHLC